MRPIQVAARTTEAGIARRTADRGRRRCWRSQRRHRSRARWRCQRSRRSADREKPIRYSSNNLDGNETEQTVLLTGKVEITQGTIALKADRVVLKQQPDGAYNATATGKPVTFRQKMDNSDEYVEAQALRIEYLGSKDLVELYDQGWIKRGKDELQGEFPHLQLVERTVRRARPGRRRRQPAADRPQGLRRDPAEAWQGSGTGGTGATGATGTRGTGRRQAAGRARAGQSSACAQGMRAEACRN